MTGCSSWSCSPWHQCCGAFNKYFRVRMSSASRDVQESYSRVTATLAESVNGIRVTQGFVRHDVNAELFRTLILDHARGCAIPGGSC